MHLLYLDDSGSADNPGEDHLVLGGLSIFEAQAHHITTELDKLATDFDSINPFAVEFHASEIFSGRTPPWDQLSKVERIGVIKQVLRIFAETFDTARAFACAVHKASFTNDDPMVKAFEDLCSRFDLYLDRLFTGGDRQRGLIILDNSSYETSLISMARDFRTIGTQWRVLRHLADTPMFLDSKSSRIVQVADHIAYATFRRYEHGDASYFDIIAAKFDSENGVLHGLSHLQRSDPSCMCPACLSRRMRP